MSDLNALLDRPLSTAEAREAIAGTALDVESAYIAQARTAGIARCFDDLPHRSTEVMRVQLEKMPMFLADGRQVPNRRALYNRKTDKYVADVGANFQVIPPDAVADTVDAVVKASGAKVTNAFAVGSGRIVGADLVLPREFVTRTKGGGNDLNLAAITITCPNDGTGTMKVWGRTYRMSCRNAYHLLQGDSHRRAGEGLSDGRVPIQAAFIGMRHTADAAANRDRLMNMMRALEPLFERFGAEMTALARRQITEAEAKKFFNAVNPVPEIPKGTAGDELKRLLNKTLRVESTHDTMARLLRANEDPTAWGALNAATAWAQHERKVVGEATRPDAKVRNGLPGGAAYNLTVHAEMAANEMFLAR